MIIKTTHIIKLFPILFLLVAHSLFSQTDKHKLDSIENIFSKASGLERIELIADFIRNANFHKTDHYRFKPYLEEAFEWEKQHPNIVLLNTLNLGYANVLIAENNLEEALRSLHEILKSGEYLTQKDSISTYDFLFGLYKNVGAYSEAWRALQIRDNVIEHVPETNPTYIFYNKLRMEGYPILLLKTKQYEKSALAFRKQISYANMLKDLHAEAGGLNNLGLVYLKLNQSDSAIWAFNQSKVRWKKYLQGHSENGALGDRAFLGLLDGNIGSAYNQKGEYEKAIPLIRNQLEAFKNDNYLGLVSPLNELSISYFGLKEYQMAISLLDSANRIPKIEHSPSKLRKIYESKIQALEGYGNVNEALKLFKKLTIFNDSMRQVENNKRVAVLQVVYEVKNKERELVNQKKDNAILDSQNKIKKQFLYFGGVGLISIFGFILLIRSRNSVKRKKELQESFSQDLIEAQESERTRLARELHDSVGQKLMLLTKKTKLVENSDLSVLSENTLEELRAISRGLYPPMIEGLGLTIATESMINEIDKHSSIFFTNEIENIDNVLSKDNELHVYRIIQEVLSNIVKHADAKAVFITVEKKENHIKLSVEDNGKGFDFLKKLKSPSLGMKTLNERTKIIKSKLDVKSQSQKGTLVQLEIPI